MSIDQVNGKIRESASAGRLPGSGLELQPNPEGDDPLAWMGISSQVFGLRAGAEVQSHGWVNLMISAIGLLVRCQIPIVSGISGLNCDQDRLISNQTLCI